VIELIATRTSAFLRTTPCASVYVVYSTQPACAAPFALFATTAASADETPAVAAFSAAG